MDGSYIVVFSLASGGRCEGKCGLTRRLDFRSLPLTFRKVATSRLFFCELVSDIEVRCNMKQHVLLLWNPALVV